MKMRRVSKARLEKTSASDEAGGISPLNQVYRQSAINDPSFYDTQVKDPMAGIVSSTVSFGNTTISRGNLLHPHPLFDGITANTIPAVHYRYDGLQVKVETLRSPARTICRSAQAESF